MTTVYRGAVTRGEAGWIASTRDLPEGKQAIAGAKNLKQLQTMIQGMAERCVNLPPGSVVVDLELEDPELQQLVDEVHAARANLRAAQDEADVALGRAARRLTRIAPVRDVAHLLGYSHQYIARRVPKSALKEAEGTGDTPQDWAKMLYVVAGMKTPASSADLASEARSWLDTFPDDPDFLRQVTAEHRALIGKVTEETWES